MSGVGNIQCRLDACNPAANHQSAFCHRDQDRFQFGVAFDFFSHNPYHIYGFSRCFLFIRMDPGTVLADIGHFAEIGIKPGRSTGFAEGGFMHPG